MAEKSGRSAWGVYGLLLAASLAYCPMLFSGLDQWGRGDWDQFTFRFDTPRTAMLRDGELPAWNPYVGGGNVLAAHPHCPAFSPWFLLTLALGAPLGLRVGVVMFMTIGAVGMAVVLRDREVSPAGCFVGGVLLMLSAHFAMHITEGHLEWCLLGLMPWVYWCLTRAVDDWRWILLGSLIMASAVLHGSIYIVVVFAPMLGIWALAESIRTRTFKPAAAWALTMCLSCSLAAVAVIPRVAFLRANPRKTDLHEQVAPAALGQMLLNPRQADLFRATRDVRNPPAKQLARILPTVSTALGRPYEALKWHRLDVEAATNSDWTDVRIEGSPFILASGSPQQINEIARRLDSMQPSTEGLSLKNPAPGQRIAGRATLFTRLPETGELQVAVTRGNAGATKFTVRRGDEVLLEDTHSKPVPGDLSNRRIYAIPRDALLQKSDDDKTDAAAAWHRLSVTLHTTADWCNVEPTNSPYLFCIESPAQERENPVRLSVSALAVSGSTAPLRAVLLVQSPSEEELKIQVTQGRLGDSTLTFTSLDGKPLEANRRQIGESDQQQEKTFEYALARSMLDERLASESTPWRWRLDGWGMTRDWHEYGCYLTWLGLAMAVAGAVAVFRQQWPLLVTGLAAAVITAGAALPANVWALWKQLPMYGSLQVPSRFLVAVVFVAALCAGHGVDWLGHRLERRGGAWLARVVTWVVAAVIYAELAVLGWNLFSDIFVCPPRPVSTEQHATFAQRFAEDEVRYAAMYSAFYPYVRDNSGVLREYENIAIPRGKVRTASDPDYQGEAYLQQADGSARIERQSMSRVDVSLDGLGAANRLVLNQNYDRGWRAVRHRVDGQSESVMAEPNDEGLVSLAVGPEDRQVEFYYRPPGFACGAVISGLTLLGCLIALRLGTRRDRRSVGLVDRLGAMVRRPWFGPTTTIVLLNVPFLLCFPTSPWIETPLLRSLAVNAVLFVAPGVALVGLMTGRNRSGWVPFLWVVVTSIGVFLAILVFAYLAGLPIGPSGAWTVTWIITNAALAVSLATGRWIRWSEVFEPKYWLLGGLLAMTAYPLYFYAATRVAPGMEDHDYVVQGTGYGLLRELKPRLLTDREISYEFAHPPLLHFCVAGSFLYFDQLDPLRVYQEALDRAEAGGRGEEVEPIVREFYHMGGTWLVRRPDPGLQGATLHRITGQDGSDFVVDPPMPKLGDRIPVRDFELHMLYDTYRHAPHRLATRTPGLFLAAWAVAALGVWVARRTDYVWLAALVALAYATSPQVFVRSGTGGYFAISQLALLQVLFAVEQFMRRSCGLLRDRTSWVYCLVAGVFAALVNHKLMLLPAAVVVWELFRLGKNFSRPAAAKALLHPVVLGFGLGIVVFWAWGLSVDAQVFWDDHFKAHLLDRITHYNPFGYQGYPSVPGLWLELWQHTGYLLLPLGIVSLIVLCCRDRGAGLREEPGLWAVWAVMIFVAFSLIDWRQTKHVMPILLPLCMAPPLLAATGRKALLAVGLLLGAVLLWNGYTLQALAIDFSTLQPAPDW